MRVFFHLLWLGTLAAGVQGFDPKILPLSKTSSMDYHQHVRLRSNQHQNRALSTIPYPIQATQQVFERGTVEMEMIWRPRSWKKFGNAVALDAENNRAVMGHSHDGLDGETYSGAAFVYERATPSSSWTSVARIAPHDPQNSSYFAGPLAIRGHVIVGSAYNKDEWNGNSLKYSAGAVYVFEQSSNGQSWIEMAKLTRPGGSQYKTYFGSDVAIAENAQRIFVGASKDNGEGAVYVYEKNTAGEWMVQDTIRPPEDAYYFGQSISIYGSNVVAIGSPGDNNSGSNPGYVYIFQKQGTSWVKVARLEAPWRSRCSRCGFGAPLDLSPNGRFLAVGSRNDWGFVFERTQDQAFDQWTLRGAFQDYFDGSPLNVASQNGLGGTQVAMSDTAAFFSATRAGGADSNSEALNAGAVYMAQLSPTKQDGSWELTHKVARLRGGSGEFFGDDLAVSGGTLLVGNSAAHFMCSDLYDVSESAEALASCESFNEPGCVFSVNVNTIQKTWESLPHPLTETMTLQTPSGQRIMVEVGRSTNARANGLAFRTVLEANHGFLFMYGGSTATRSMSNSNIYFPLDLVFMDGNFKVLNIIENTEPLSRTLYSSLGANVLAVLGGTAKGKFGLKVGDSLLSEINHKYDLKGRPPTGIAYSVRNVDDDPEKGLVTFRAGSNKLVTFELLIARTNKVMHESMRYYDTIPDKGGMIFVLDDQSSGSLIKHKVNFSTDIVLVDQDLTVVEIFPNLSPDYGFLSYPEPRRFIVQVKAGSIAKYGIAVGDTLSFMPVPTNVGRIEIINQCVLGQAAFEPSQREEQAYVENNIERYYATVEQDDGLVDEIDVFVFPESYYGSNGVGTNHLYALDGYDASTCRRICVFAYTGCSQDAECEETWFGAEGYAYLHNRGDDRLAVELVDLKLREIGSSLSFVEQPWCIDHYEFDVPIDRQCDDDADNDNDGVPNCRDECPNDPLKTKPGICGCGKPEILTDTDNDGVPDCIDECPNDPEKTVPGQCGCGFPETDTDQDGIADCNDKCPNDPHKAHPGVCGCGTPDTDSDGDGTPDCLDECPDDPLKTKPGQCGCGVVDDGNNDQTLDCLVTDRIYVILKGVTTKMNPIQQETYTTELYNFLSLALEGRSGNLPMELTRVSVANQVLLDDGVRRAFSGIPHLRHLAIHSLEVETDLQGIGANFVGTSAAVLNDDSRDDIHGLVPLLRAADPSFFASLDSVRAEPVVAEPHEGDDDDDDDDDDDKIIIAASVSVGGVVLIIMIVSSVVWWKRSRRRTAEDNDQRSGGK